jgi:hypothetical protein
MSDPTAKTRTQSLTKSLSLAYNAFGYGAPNAEVLAVGLLDLKIGNIQPSSKPNFFVAPYVVTGGLGTPEITTTYPGSNVVSFDAESIASGCYVATNNGAAAPAIACTIRFTGRKAVTDEEVIFDKAFTVGPQNVIGISLPPVPVQKVVFPATFKGLKSLKPKVIVPALPVLTGLDGPLKTIQMAFDDFTYTAYVKN